MHTIDKTVAGQFDDVLDRTTAALAEEGFGVLTDIDVQRTFAEKLDEEFRRYRILGACIPPLAHEALSADLAIGTLLPCNVVVYDAGDGEVGVMAVDPETLFSVVDDPALEPVAAEVAERLERALDGLVATASS